MEIVEKYERVIKRRETFMQQRIGLAVQQKISKSKAIVPRKQ